MIDTIETVDLSDLIDRYFDETIDGDKNNQEDIAVFLEPFINTLCLKLDS